MTLIHCRNNSSSRPSLSKTGGRGRRHCNDDQGRSPQGVRRLAVQFSRPINCLRKGHRDLPVFFDELNDALEAHDAEENGLIAGAMRALLTRHDE